MMIEQFILVLASKLDDHFQSKLFFLILQFHEKNGKKPLSTSLQFYLLALNMSLNLLFSITLFRCLFQLISWAAARIGDNFL